MGLQIGAATMENSMEIPEMIAIGEGGEMGRKSGGIRRHKFPVIK